MTEPNASAAATGGSSTDAAVAGPSRPVPADSSGVPLAGRSLDAHPFAGDDGRASPELADALGSGGRPDDATVMAALHGARLLVPLVPVPVADDAGTSELAAAIVAGTDGRRALAAFSSVATANRWRPDGRPVPVTAADAAVSALEEAELLVVDPAGPIAYPVAGARLRALAAGRRWLPVHLDPEVRERVDAILGGGGAQSWQLQAPGDPREDDARLEIVLGPEALPEPLVRRLAADPLLRERLERGLELAVRHAGTWRP